MKPRMRASSLLASAYFVFGTLWVVGTGVPFAVLFDREPSIEVWEIGKGLAFVAVSAVAILVATRRLYGHLDFAFEGRRLAEDRADKIMGAALQLESSVELLFQNNPQPMFIFDSETQAFRQVNDAMVRQYGWGRDELLGMRLRDIIAPEQLEEFDDDLGADDHKPAFRRPYIHCRKDGSTLHVEILAHGIQWQGRECEIVIPVDVTERTEQKQHLEAALHASVRALMRVVDIRDPYTSGHEARVGVIAARIAAEMGWGEAACEGIRICGDLHDIGKLGVPFDILSKPAKLDPEELRLVQNHARKGFEILDGLPFPWPVADVARHHHERIDGSGYPDGLKGAEIIPEARIVAVADVFESMVNHRPYRAARGWDEAIAEITDGRGCRYDPDVVDAFLRVVARCKTIERLTAA
jgi:PAS domain S-box-containing protein